MLPVSNRNKNSFMEIIHTVSTISIIEINNKGLHAARSLPQYEYVRVRSLVSKMESDFTVRSISMKRCCPKSLTELTDPVQLPSTCLREVHGRRWKNVLPGRTWW